MATPKKITPAQYVILKRKGKTQGKNFIVTAKATPAATRKAPRIQPKPAARTEVTPAAWIQIKTPQAPAMVKATAPAAIVKTDGGAVRSFVATVSPAAIQQTTAAARNLSTGVDNVVKSFDTAQINQSMNQAQAADISAQLDEQEPAGMDKKKMIIIGALAAAGLGAFLFFRRK